MRKFSPVAALATALLPTASALAQDIQKIDHANLSRCGVEGAALPLWSAAPFLGILLSAAAFPVLADDFWRRHYGKVTAFWALAFAIPFVAWGRANALCDLTHAVLDDYLSFIILLAALYAIAGGIIVRGSARGRPLSNLAMLAVGAALASAIGTIGASLVMIRPLLRANAWRKHRAHLAVFLIFAVGNIGGSLTPMGNPPLYLGYLNGVDFLWTLRLAPIAGFTLGLTLAAFFVIDTLLVRRETPPPADGVKEPFRVEGLPSLAILAGVMAVVLLSSSWHLPALTIGGVELAGKDVLRNALFVALGALSLVVADRRIRRDNEFHWGPLTEFAILFAGIFVTIAPALAILRAGPAGAAAPLIARVNEPGHFFWASGALSGVLDNAPTYLAFFTAAIGKLYGAGVDAQAAAGLLMGREAALAAHPGAIDGSRYLLAISAGSTFMGALTYIGNAPNFLIKSIAESAGVRMPSFFGYTLKYALPILAPVFVAATIVFFA